ncbi:MAG: hypothetical protein H7Z17_17790, partial [Fuerstia sp.]|nr:hypothetical protein [Fuerstiella sp.]
KVNQRAHLLSLVTDGIDTFVLSTIPAAGAEDQSITTRTVISEPGLSNYRVCGVYGGHLFALKQPIEFVAIDLATGVKKQITQAWCENAILAGHHLFFVVGTGSSTESGKPSHALHVMDLRTGNQRELCQMSSARASMQSYGHDFTLAATADGAQIAVTEMIPAAGQFSMQASSRIVVVDMPTGEVTRSQPDFAGRPFMTGGGGNLLAPKIVWIDNESLLVVASDAAKSSDGSSNTVVIDLNSGLQKMFQYQPKTQTTELICPLPNFPGQMHDPWFSRERDGQIVIHLGSRGPFAVDLKKKELMEHDVVIGDYVLEQAGGVLSLHYGEKVLATETEQSRVFASPDGQRIAWLPVAARGGINIMEPVELKMHDRVRGVRSVLTKRFPRNDTGPQSPTTNVCLWLTDADLNRSDVFDQLMVIENLPEPPHIDSRPAAKDFVEVSLKTDKESYLLHEPIELTITIRNLAKTPIRFESRLLKQGAQPFNDLYLASQNSNVQIQLCDRHMIESLGEFVEILPGQSRVFTRTVESGDVGKHNFRMRFEQYSAWKGHLNAAAPRRIAELDLPLGQDGPGRAARPRRRPRRG